MFSDKNLKIISDLTGSSSREQLAWLHGYIAALLQDANPEKKSPDTILVSPGKITITYGTETGNAKKLAAQFTAKAKKAGIQAKLVALDQYRPADLEKEECFLTVVSTQGEGEPPAAAQKFYHHIHHLAEKLANLKYGVLALGDTSYPLFCKAGEDVDAQLDRLGGQRIVPLRKCDTDFETDAEEWFSMVLDQLHNQKKTATPFQEVVTKKRAEKKTYTGTKGLCINLNDRGSSKETYHIEIEADDVLYEPGDSLGLVPPNSKEIVKAIISNLEIEGDEDIIYQGNTISFSGLLQNKLNILYLPLRVVQKYAALVRQDIPATRMDLLDLLRIYPLEKGQWRNLAEILEPIAPRLYSISSSPEAHAGEVHLTVSRNRLDCEGERKYGHCSDYLSQLPLGSTFSFYIHRNEQFRLPENESDIIMIGPGTGIAPFRSFLAHRDASGAGGRSWLFFGEQHFVSDFLYQSEIQSWLETGVLTKANTAFSRDQPEKLYVQHRMQQEGRALYEWIDQGARIYVCGSRDPMSLDVEKALLEIIERHGEKNKDAAIQYLHALKEEGRYVKDVY